MNVPVNLSPLLLAWLVIGWWQPIPAAVAQTPREPAQLRPGVLDRSPRLDPSDRVTPEGQQRIESYDAGRRQQSAQTGESFLPTMTGPVVATPPPVTEEQLYDGVGSGDSLVSAFRAEGPGAAMPPAAGSGDPGGQADRIQALLARRVDPGIAQLYRFPATMRPTAAASDRLAAAQVLVRAGDAVYARLIATANSEYTGPVLAEILSGPLRGTRLSGGFTRVRTALVLRFTRLSAGQGAITVDAYGVDPDCDCYGVAGIVDHHWLERVLLPTASAFASGFLRAASQPDRQIAIDGSTIFTETRRGGTREHLYAGGARAIDQAATVLEQTAPTGPTVRVAAGTPLTVIFARAVLGRVAALAGRGP